MSHALATIYASLPTLTCQRKCQAVCGPINPPPVERMRILRRTRQSVGTSEVGGTVCRLLEADGRCAVYEDRPMICRLVGLTHETACPHGCKPERWLSDDEAYQAMRAVFQVRP